MRHDVPLLYHPLYCNTIYSVIPYIQQEETHGHAVKKGALELCVLSQLVRKDYYGYELTEILSAELSTAAGTLYLILKRLKDLGYVETYLKKVEKLL